MSLVKLSRAQFAAPRFSDQDYDDDDTADDVDKGGDDDMMRQ